MGIYTFSTSILQKSQEEFLRTTNFPMMINLTVHGEPHGASVSYQGIICLCVWLVGGLI